MVTKAQLQTDLRAIQVRIAGLSDVPFGINQHHLALILNDTVRALQGAVSLIPDAPELVPASDPAPDGETEWKLYQSQWWPEQETENV